MCCFGAHGRKRVPRFKCTWRSEGRKCVQHDTTELMIDVVLGFMVPLHREMVALQQASFFAYLGAAVSRCEDETDMASQKWGGKWTVSGRYEVTFSFIWGCVSDFLANEENPILTVFWAQLLVSTSWSPTVLAVFFLKHFYWSTQLTQMQVCWKVSWEKTLLFLSV